METNWLPHIKIDFDRVSIYDLPENYSYNFSEKHPEQFFTADQDDSFAPPPDDRAHSGTLSDTARKNLMRCIERFVFYTDRMNNLKKASGRKGKRTIKFVTLTLSSAQDHSDTEIKIGPLNQFLTELRTRYKMKHYVWKAEKQKNGNLHFHLLIDVYIHYREIREIWNRCQNTLGYVDRFAKRMELLGFDGYREAALLVNPNLSAGVVRQRWQRLQESNYSDPPSTEIRNLAKVKKVKAYFKKYMAKGSAVDPGFGRIWFASRSLTNNISLTSMAGSQAQALISFLKANYQDHLRHFDHASIFFVPFSCLEEFQENTLVRLFSAKLSEVVLEFF